MFQSDWLILRILHQSFEMEIPKDHLSEVVVHIYIYTQQKKKRTTYNRYTLRNITTDRPVSSIPMHRYVSYCCVTHLLQSGVKNVLKKIGHESSGGQIVTSQKISGFAMTSCWINSSNVNRLSRPNCIQTLILCKFYL